MERKKEGGRMKKKVLTIGGSDPFAGGGIQTDLKTFENHQQFGLSVLTSIVTSNEGQFEIHSLTHELLDQQLLSLDEVTLAAIKIGLLTELDHIKQVKEFLEAHPAIPVIFDPVLVMKESNTLRNHALIEAFMTDLAPLATVMTPNLDEADQLAKQSITNKETLTKAAKKLSQLSGGAVVIKGGSRLAGPDAIDCLAIGEKVTYFQRAKQANQFENGAGCAFSASLAAQLADEVPLEQAVRQAKEYVYQGLQTGIEVAPNFGSFWHRSSI